MGLRFADQDEVAMGLKDDAEAVVPFRARPTLPSRIHGPNAADSKRLKTVKSVSDKVHDNMARIANQFRYVPLAREARKTRLLKVQPRSTHTRGIYATLYEVPYTDLGQKPWQYEALSYWWGDGEATEMIHIRNDPDIAARSQRELVEQGKKPGSGWAPILQVLNYREFRVKKNLYDALIHIRHYKEPIYVWVDALCIDQSQPEEKKWQIANMDKIYTKAETVLIWLGMSNDRTRNAFEFIDEILAVDQLNTLVSDEADRSRASDWSDFFSLMRREWFSRRWVIQELAFAKDAVVKCGEDETHWNDFRDAVSMFALKVDDIRNLFKRSRKFDHDYNAIEVFEGLGARVLVDTINNVFRAPGTEEGLVPILGLEYLVSTLSTFEGSDPRDTVHALRNIAKETSIFNNGKSGQKVRQELYLEREPDYQMDLLQVYIEFVKWVEINTGCIDIICRYWALPEKTERTPGYPKLVKLPSWIQQISKSPFGRQSESRGRVHGDSFVGLPDHKSYNASCGKSAKIRYGIDQMPAAPSKSPKKKHTQRKVTLGYDPSSHAPVKNVEVTRHSTTASPYTPPTSFANMMSRPQEANGIAAMQANHSAEIDASGATAATAADDPLGIQPIGAAAGSAKIDYATPAMFAESHTAEPDSHPIIASDPGLNISRLSKEQKEALSKTIFVKGLHVGTLTWVTDQMPDGIIPNRVLERLGHSPEQYGNSTSGPPDKLWRTLVAERGADGRNPPAWYRRACQHCLAHDTPNGNINTKELLQRDQPDWIRDFLKRIQAVTWNRVFLEAAVPVVSNDSPDATESEPATPVEETTTAARQMVNGANHQPASEQFNSDPQRESSTSQSAHRPLTESVHPRFLKSLTRPRLHGLGPSEAEVNDWVCILFGCSVPCILRKSKDELGEHFTFIGDAYIYGLMDGEAIISKKSVDDKAISFEIR